MKPDASPTARALLALELVQGSPGITADRLADKLGVSERAARRYVGILREAGIPIESVRGPYGGYRVGRGLRLPPLMFSAAEALGLVMAVLDGHHDASDPTDPVGSALGKIMRALPEPVAAQAEAVRRTTAPAPDRAAARPDPGDHDRPRAGLLEPPTGAARLPLRGRVGVGHRGRPVGGRRPPRPVVPAVPVALPRTPGGPTGSTGSASVEVLDDTFSPPADLDPVAMLEEHLAVGWEYDVEVVIDAPVDTRGALPSPRPRTARAARRRRPPDWSAAPATRGGTPSSSRRSRRRTGSCGAPSSRSARASSGSGCWRRRPADSALLRRTASPRSAGLATPGSMYHSVPNALAKKSSGICNIMPASLTWLAWQASVSVLRPSVPLTSTAQVLARLPGCRTGCRRRPGRSGRSPSFYRVWLLSANNDLIASRFIVASSTCGVPGSIGSAAPDAVDLDVVGMPVDAVPVIDQRGASARSATRRLRQPTLPPPRRRPSKKRTGVLVLLPARHPRVAVAEPRKTCCDAEVSPPRRSVSRRRRSIRSRQPQVVGYVAVDAVGGDHQDDPFPPVGRFRDRPARSR